MSVDNDWQKGHFYTLFPKVVMTLGNNVFCQLYTIELRCRSRNAIEVAFGSKCNVKIAELINIKCKKLDFNFFSYLKPDEKMIYNIHI